jgi:hypothetical protein
VRLNFKPAGSSQGTSNLASVVSTVQSGPYPDPYAARFQCDGADRTRYCDDESCFDFEDEDGCTNPGNHEDPTDGYGPSGLCGIFPAEPYVGFGIANASGARYLVVGNGLRGKYNNNLDGEKDVSQYRVSVYPQTGGAALATRGVAGQTSSGELAIEASAVGDFLGDDGTDEVRILRVRETATGTTFSWIYFGIPNLNEIARQTVSTTAP